VSAFSIKFDADAALAKLDAIGEAAAEVRPAAQAGAQVLYEEVLARVPVRSGLLKSSIYQVFSKDNSSEARATYHISWNARKAPHGHLVEKGRRDPLSMAEFGTSRKAARPFLRPAYDAKIQAALKTARDAWIESTRRALAGVAA
jgi:HK97 gp10 family phage protein